jgi:PAS domain S-box-containing protein
MDFVCIDRLEGDGLTARTVAVWCDGHFEDNVTYALKDTPCGDVVGKTVCCFPASVCQLFPRDQVLRDLRAESYVGVTLWSHTGQPLGLIAVIGHGPLANRAQAEATLKLVAVRAAGELERLQSEEALRESEARYAMTLTAVNDGLWDWHIPSGKAFFSGLYYTILGYEDGAFPATYDSWRLLVHPEDIERVERELRKCVESGGSFAIDLRMKKQSAEWLWVSTRGKAMELTAGGQALRMVGTLSDITERKRAEDALRLASDRLLLAVRAGKVATWDWDIVNDRLIWDEAMYRLYGGSSEQFNGAYEAWLQGVHQEDRAREREKTQQALSGSKEYDTEFRVVWPDESVHYIQANGMVQRDTAGRPVRMLGTNWDITERKQAYDLIRESLREKEALLKEVHHRVKNNLQVITSLLRMEARRSEHPATKSVLDEMKSRILSMALLHESLYRSGTFASVDLGTYLKQLTNQSFRALAVRPGSVRLQLELASVQVEMDQALPCGLLVNELISNCLKHGFPGDRSGEVRVDLQLVDSGPQLRLRVSDTGVGLPADFESKRGKSLGLQLVSNLARQIDGQLEVGPGPGAVFEVIFTPKYSKPNSSTPPP